MNSRTSEADMQLRFEEPGVRTYGANVIEYVDRDLGRSFRKMDIMS